MKFVPYNDKILVKPIKVESMMVQDTGQFEERGIVQAVGKSVKFCKVGDTVFFASWLVHKVPGEEDLYVIPENSGAILGKLEKDGVRKK